MQRQLTVILLVLVAMVAASAAVVAFTVERLRDEAETKSAMTLEACLADNMVANLTALGEELINRACNERAKDRTSSVASCVFARRDAMTSEDATRDVARRCGVTPTSL
jgi:hypothetical protein